MTGACTASGSGGWFGKGLSNTGNSTVFKASQIQIEGTDKNLQ